jgi:UDP-glucose 4-epimerase
MLLVTGCNGYVGESLLRRLNNEGIQFTCIDLSNCGQNVTGHVNCDISNKADLDRLKTNFGPFDGVIHLAAIKTVVSNGREAEEIMKHVNLEGTNNLISILSGSNSSFFIFASSAAVYGENLRHEVISEDFLLNPLSLYGKTKLQGEISLMRSFAGGEISKIICLRFFNISGHDLAALNTTSKLEGAICHAANAYHSGKVFTVYGSNLNNPDGTSIRDYVHVLDVVESIFQSLRLSLETQFAFFEKINICTGNGTSLQEIILNIESLSSGKLRVGLSNPRLGEVEFSIGNPSEAFRVINWRPKLNISTIIASELDHHKQ